MQCQTRSEAHFTAGTPAEAALQDQLAELQEGSQGMAGFVSAPPGSAPAPEMLAVLAWAAECVRRGAVAGPLQRGAALLPVVAALPQVGGLRFVAR